MDYTISIPDDLAEVEDPQAALVALDEQLAPVWQARAPLATLADAVAQVAHASAEASQALGRQPGTPWRQPYGHTSYPKGHIVTDDGRLWSSDIDWNTWKPGVYGWTDEGEAPITPPDPTEAEPWVLGDTFEVGDVRSDDGQVYYCTTAHTAHDPGWHPSAFPTYWTLID